jgi:hypothetical protein
MCSRKATVPVAGTTQVSGQPGPVSSEYQRARINVFVAPRFRQQIDALSGEWGTTLVETVRRLLSLGLGSYMQADLPSHDVCPFPGRLESPRSECASRSTPHRDDRIEAVNE